MAPKLGLRAFKEKRVRHFEHFFPGAPIGFWVRASVCKDDQENSFEDLSPPYQFLLRWHPKLSCIRLARRVLSQGRLPKRFAAQNYILLALSDSMSVVAPAKPDTTSFV